MKLTGLLTLTLLLQGGCASLFSGTTQKVAIHSEPPGAKIFVDEVYCGDTPRVVDVRRSLDTRQLTLRKDGYADVHTFLRARFNPISLINLVEPIGWVVDALTGAIAKFDNNVHVELAANNVGATTASTPVRRTLAPSVAAAPAASTHRRVLQAKRR